VWKRDRWEVERTGGRGVGKRKVKSEEIFLVMISENSQK
jgi:hypothetical protein